MPHLELACSSAALVDSHCHLLLGMFYCLQDKEALKKAVEISYESYQRYGQLVELTSNFVDDSLIVQANQRLDAMLSSSISHFYIYTTSYLDAKLTLEFLEQYSAHKKSYSKADLKERLTVGVGLHPYMLAKVLQASNSKYQAQDVASQEHALNNEQALNHELELLKGLLTKELNSADTLVGALGEIGLDKRLEPDLPLALQELIVERFIKDTAHFKLPYSLHCVRSYQELDALIMRLKKEQRYQDLSFTIHGFNSSDGQGIALLKHGFNLGLGRALLSPVNEHKFSKLISSEYAQGKFMLESDFDVAKGDEYDLELIAKLLERYRALKEVKERTYKWQ